MKGTRLVVEFVIDLLAQGWTEAEITRNYIELSQEDIRACLLYASTTLKAERVYLLKCPEHSSMRILADENFPRDGVDALRRVGHDVAWVAADAPGSGDVQVLERSGRVSYLGHFRQGFR